MDERHDDEIEELDEIIRRIVRVAAPEQIILFGSTARGEAGPHGDLDLIVIKAGDGHHHGLMATIYNALDGINRDVDIIVASTDDVERYGNSHVLVIAPALREGRVVYAA